MPSPTTAGQLIKAALALTNSVGVDQTLTADETTDCLSVFNDILEEWSLDALSLWDSANQSFLLTPGKATYTIGAGGDFNAERPIDINQPMYTVLNGLQPTDQNAVSYPASMMTQQEYNLIAIKGQQQQYPERYLYVGEFPLGQITFWPVPSATNYVTISMNRLLSQVASAGTVITFPPGYAKAFRYCLAVELAPQFGKQASASVAKTAMTSYASVKKANARPRVSQFDIGLRNLEWRNWQGYTP